MKPRFSPTREGAQHVLDEQDVVIARGTPVFHRDTGSTDSRIRISRNGYAERAMWVRLHGPLGQPGPQGEFHLWRHQLDESAISRIDVALNSLGEVFVTTSANHDPN